MRRTLAIVLASLAAVLAVTSNILVIQADLPSGETAGKIALAWFPILMAVTVISSRRNRVVGSKELP